MGDRLFIEIFPEIRRQDVEDKWSGEKWLIKILFAGRQKRRRPRPQLDRDLHTRIGLGSGRGIDEIVVWDYDYESFYEEDLARERLRPGANRVKRAQAQVSNLSAEPTSEWQLDRHAKMRGN